ncbi:MAG: PilZ domain-containing protein [Planctomycetota bacterium]
MNDPRFVESVRMGERELRRLLTRMARDAQNRQNDDPRRASERAYRRVLSVPLTIRTGAGVAQAYRVPMLDLSATGAGLVFGRFVHPGSEVKLALTTLERKVEVVDGTVAWCKHHDNSLHRVGVQFEEPLEMRKFSLDYAMSEQIDGYEDEDEMDAGSGDGSAAEAA